MADRVETNIVLIGSRQWYRAADGAHWAAMKVWPYRVTVTDRGKDYVEVRHGTSLNSVRALVENELNFAAERIVIERVNED
jgi:hypothetical protein